MLYAETQQAKTANIEFKNISVFKEVVVEKEISDKFIDLADVGFFEINLSEIKDIANTERLIS